MKILIVSDTHRENSNFMKALDKEKPIDLLIHCGDIEGSEYLYSQAARCATHMVTGNNDFFSQLPSEKLFRIDSHTVFLTHGHRYYASMGPEYLIREALDREADIVMYGHTHKPVAQYENGILVLNPGSLTYPRQEGRRPSYIVMDVDRKGEIEVEIKYL